MNEITIKGVGKKIILGDDILTITKVLGKDIVIPLTSIVNIDYTEGTLSANGTFNVTANINGKEIKNSIFFFYSSNKIVAQVVNYIKNPAQNNTSINQEKISMFQQVKNETNNNIVAKQEESKKLKGYDREGIPYCPKCHSTRIQYVERKKQLSVGRAIVGGVLIGGAGAVLGGVTSKKYKGRLKCLKCGHEWKI